MEEYARKRIHNGFSVQIENSVTRDNSYPRDGNFNPHFTTIENSYTLDCRLPYI